MLMPGKPGTRSFGTTVVCCTEGRATMPTAGAGGCARLGLLVPAQPSMSEYKATDPKRRLAFAEKIIDIIRIICGI